MMNIVEPLSVEVLLRGEMIKSIEGLIDDLRNSLDNANAWLSSEEFTASTVRRHKFHVINLTSSRCIKALLTGDLFSRFLRRNQLKRKEKLRLQLAHVHAALSVARLAAAIAGAVANYSPETSKNKGRYSTIFGRVGGVWDKKMSMVVASAATLVATVCAEAAECVGAQRADIASAISQGLATHKSTEILGLTATAATCKYDFR
ncbi:hypothetical protein AXF42_Ash002039 [Apostasia shenzhenica]|uniref:VAN3-binding protein-like auxin canalisation domain-containing protein n=1 Tax=Apostasia shenzhenica TaxID=1088818 RepID=A0A2I0ABY7_9ASPA|nr:hypothetical protein AXF42_Ash002039 [Apostasia shenzhenica]